MVVGLHWIAQAFNFQDNMPAWLGWVAVVLLSHVNYRSGQMHDMAAVTRQAHERGALVIWDLAHAAGAVPVDLNGADADYAVGCTYKYLNGGPGSPAFIWVAPRHIPDFWQPLSGWWGHQRPFDMTVAYEPAGGIRRYLCGTQPIVSLAMVECGLDVAREADIPNCAGSRWRWATCSSPWSRNAAPGIR